MYGLPKVQKSKEIAKAIRVCDTQYLKIKLSTSLTFRSIVTGYTCPTSGFTSCTQLLYTSISRHCHQPLSLP